MSKTSDFYEESERIRRASSEWCKRNEPYYKQMIEYLTLVQGKGCIMLNLF